MHRRGRTWRRLGRIGAAVGVVLAAALTIGPVASARTVPSDMFGASGGWYDEYGSWIHLTASNASSFGVGG